MFLHFSSCENSSRDSFLEQAGCFDVESWCNTSMQRDRIEVTVRTQLSICAGRPTWITDFLLLFSVPYSTLFILYTEMIISQLAEYTINLCNLKCTWHPWEIFKKVSGRRRERGYGKDLSELSSRVYDKM